MMPSAVVLFVLLTADTSAVFVPSDATPVPEELHDQFILDDMLDVVTEDEASPLLDRLLWLHEHPLDLNRATGEQLTGIPGITPVAADDILRLRKSLGRFDRLQQLSTLGGGEQIVESLRPFVTIIPEERVAARRAVEVRSRTKRDMQTREGYRSGAYAGSPVSAYSRLIAGDEQNYQIGVLVEKDAGERTAEGFASGYVLGRNPAFLSNLIIGDYVVEAGQGLVIWSGSSFGKGGISSIAPRKSGRGIHPYRSADEFHFLRGAAGTWSTSTGVGTFTATGFQSWRSLPATVRPDGSVSSFHTNGTFRTESERAKRNAVRETIAGSRLSFVAEPFSIGVTAAHTRFDRHVSLVRGKRSTNATTAGVDYEIEAGRARVFGESALAGSGGMAHLSGVVVDVGRRITCVFSYRDYAESFGNLRARGFGERDGTQGERGFYAGLRIPFRQWLKVSAFVDQFKFPGATATVPLPTSGRELYILVEMPLATRVTLNARYSSKATEGKVAVLDELDRSIRTVTERVQQRLRLGLVHDVSRVLRLKARVEGTEVRYGAGSGRERGMLLSHDVQWKPSPVLVLEGRLTFFHTSSYDARLYMYETDLRGVYSNPPLFGKGRRWYAVARYRTPGPFVLSAKYAGTQKEGVTSMSSGAARIAGDLDTRIALQLDMSF